VDLRRWLRQPLLYRRREVLRIRRPVRRDGAPDQRRRHGGLAGSDRRRADARGDRSADRRDGPTQAPATDAPPLGEFVRRTAGPDQGSIPPGGLAIAPDGTIWAPDPVNDRFAVFDRDGDFVEYWGEPGDGEGQFALTRENGDGYGQVAFASDGSFYVLDVGNHRVQRFDADRGFVTAWGEFGTGPGQYSDPFGIDVDRDGYVYVADDIRGLAEKYEPDGTIVDSIDVFSNTTPGFNKGNLITVDDEGNLFVGQATPNQIAKFSPAGELLATIGKGTFVLEYPGQVAIDAAGRLFVTAGPERQSLPGIIVFSPDGTFLGGFGPLGLEEGTMGFPIGVALDGEGTAFVLDFGGATFDDLVGELQQWRLLPPLAP
jgi:hypothetical protein